MSQVHQLPKIPWLDQHSRKWEQSELKTWKKEVRLKEVAPQKTRYAQDLATEKGCMWLTSLLLKEMRFNLNKREFRDGLSLSLCYDWPIAKIPSTCLCGEPFTKGHTMICMRGGFVIQRQRAPGPGRRAPEHGLQRCSYWTSTPRRRAVDTRVKQSAGCKIGYTLYMRVVFGSSSD